MFEVLGFVFEIVFLGLGIYLLLLSQGRIKAKNPEAQQRMDEFRLENKSWMMLGGFALVLIMGGSLLIHLWQLFG